MPTPQPSMAALLERVEAIITRLDRLSDKVDNNAAEAATFRVEYERRHAEQAARTESVAQRLTAHEEDAKEKWIKFAQMEAELRAIVKITDSLAHTNKLIAWFSGVVGGAVVLWIVSQILNVL
jgi:hypothetical protein